MKPKTGLTMLCTLLIAGCSQPPPQPRLSPIAEQTRLPYDEWRFAFFTPRALYASATHARIVDTAGYVYRFNTLDSVQGDARSVGTWSDTASRVSFRFNKVKQYPPRYIVFCWDSVIDKKTYQTSMFFPPEVWQQMQLPEGKNIAGEDGWFSTLLFGLAPQGVVRVWLQSTGLVRNLPVEPRLLKTVSGEEMDVCLPYQRTNYEYYGEIPEFIKDKTYPYGEW